MKRNFLCALSKKWLVAARPALDTDKTDGNISGFENHFKPLFGGFLALIFFLSFLWCRGGSFLPLWLDVQLVFCATVKRCAPIGFLADSLNLPRRGGTLRSFSFATAGWGAPIVFQCHRESGRPDCFSSPSWINELAHLLP